MKNIIALVTLSDEQIEKAKAANGVRKQITHCLVCGSYGQLFGTEKFCRKYFSAWKELFASLFDQVIETDSFQVKDYGSTFNLVLKLIDSQAAQQE